MLLMDKASTETLIEFWLSIKVELLLRW